MVADTRSRRCVCLGEAFLQRPWDGFGTQRLAIASRSVGSRFARGLSGGDLSWPDFPGLGLAESPELCGPLVITGVAVDGELRSLEPIEAQRLQGQLAERPRVRRTEDEAGLRHSGCSCVRAIGGGER